MSYKKLRMVKYLEYRLKPRNIPENMEEHFDKVDLLRELGLTESDFLRVNS